MLLFAFGTGVATVAIGSPDAAWAAIGHGICGMAVVLLIPKVRNLKDKSAADHCGQPLT